MNIRNRFILIILSIFMISTLVKSESSANDDLFMSGQESATLNIDYFDELNECVTLNHESPVRVDSNHLEVFEVRWGTHAAAPERNSITVSKPNTDNHQGLVQYYTELYDNIYRVSTKNKPTGSLKTKKFDPPEQSHPQYTMAQPSPWLPNNYVYDDPYPDPDPPREPRPVIKSNDTTDPTGPAIFTNERENIAHYAFGSRQSAFYWHHWQSQSEIQEILDLDYRVYDVEIVQQSPLRFQVLYVENKGPYHRESLWKHDTTSIVLGNLVENEGYRVTKLKPRQMGTALRFSAVLEKNSDGKNSRWWWDGSWDGIIQDFMDHGHRPIDMGTYQWNGETRWAGVSIENSDADERVWVPVDAVDSDTMEDLARAFYGLRLTDVDNVGGDHYGIFTACVGVEAGLNYWSHDKVPQSKVIHLIRRHGARIISIQKNSIVPGDNGLENGYFVTYVDNVTPRTGHHHLGFEGIDSAMVKSLKLGNIHGLL